MTEAATPQPHAEDPSIFDRLLDMSREAHRNGQHEVAYHALTAAMHAADDAADVGALATARTEAQAQIAHIDRVTPQHRLSTTSAARHTHPGVYALLVRQAATHIQIHDARGLPGVSTWRDTGTPPAAGGGDPVVKVPRTRFGSTGSDERSS